MLSKFQLTSRLQLWSTKLDSKTKTARGVHNLFDAKKSVSFKKMSGSSWKIRYGDGSTASGIVGTDIVNLGGLCVENQAIELASKLSAQFMRSASDGLLGLAFGKINTVKPRGVATPVESIVYPYYYPLFAPLLTSVRSLDHTRRHQRRQRALQLLPRLLARQR